MGGELVRQYAVGGLAGSFAIDAAVGIAACILLSLLLYWIPGGGFGTRINSRPLASPEGTAPIHF